MSFTTESVAFHGADGCGKSTIALNMQSILLETDTPSIIIGGSSYREWLDRGLAKDFGCNADLLAATSLDTAETTELYEDIAVACYGLAHRLTTRGISSVLIDSDPYFKRMVWAKKEKSAEDYMNYIDRFEDKMNERVGDAFPDHIVLINHSNDRLNQEQTNNIFERITRRQTNSAYDPTTIEELEDIVLATTSVWAQIERSVRFRASKATVLSIVNPQAKDKDLGSQTTRIAHEVLGKTFQKVTTLS